MSEAATPAAPILVAIDGPAGSGKSSVSRAVAERLFLVAEQYIQTIGPSTFPACEFAGQRDPAAQDAARGVRD